MPSAARAVRDAIQEIDIGPEQRFGEVALNGVPTGAVVAGSIVALDGNVTEQHAQDVLQSLLLAQLAASAKADRHKDPLAWYRTYQSTLEQIGWVVLASSNFSRYFAQVSRYTISTVITDVLRPRTSPDELSLVSRTLSAFTRDRAAPAQFVWECPSHSGGVGNFQVGLATEEESVVTLQIGRFTFEAPTQVTRLAFEEFDGGAKMHHSYVAMTLNEGIYAGLRSAIARKLENRFGGSVAQIEGLSS